MGFNTTTAIESKGKNWKADTGFGWGSGLSDAASAFGSSKGHYDQQQARKRSGLGEVQDNGFSKARADEYYANSDVKAPYKRSGGYYDANTRSWVEGVDDSSSGGVVGAASGADYNTSAQGDWYDRQKNTNQRNV